MLRIEFPPLLLGITLLSLIATSIKYKNQAKLVSGKSNHSLKQSIESVLTLLAQRLATTSLLYLHCSLFGYPTAYHIIHIHL